MFSSSIYSLTHPYIAQKSNPTIAGARQKTLGLKFGCLRSVMRSSRLLATFKEANANIDVRTVDLTCDEGEPARTAGVVIHEPTRRSERVIVPMVEKGIQRIEAKKKGKRPAWQP